MSIEKFLSNVVVDGTISKVGGTSLQFLKADGSVDATTYQTILTNPVTGTFVAGRVPYSSSSSVLTDSSRLLWNNTNSLFEINGAAPRFTLKNNLNNYSTYFTNNAGGALFLKNQQDKTLAVFNNPVTSTDQPKLAIGQVTSIPTESQLYVYGGENGANIDARGSATVDEANIDLEGNDWVTNPNSIGLSYFGSNATSFGTVMGYSKNKLGQIRFQDNTVSAITSNKVSGVSPIRFGINDVQIANISNTGFSYQSDFSSVNSSNPRWLVDKAYVDAGLATKENAFSKNTAFNKNFGTTAGTVLEGGTLGSNAYSSTPYLPLSGGDINGLLKITREGSQLSLTGSDQGAVDLYKSGALGHRLYSDINNFGIYDLVANVNRFTISNYTGAATFYSMVTTNGNMLIQGTSVNSKLWLYTNYSGNSVGASFINSSGSSTIELNGNTGAATFYSTVTATSFNGSATLTGTPTAPTATAGTNTTQIATTAFVQANARPYKTYAALLSQSGTSAPTATVLENTLGGTITWTRVNPGIYSGTLTGAFTTDKTILLNNNPVGGVFTNIFSSVNTITIQTRNYSNAQTDDGLSNTSIEIRVYN